MSAAENVFKQIIFSSVETQSSSAFVLIISMVVFNFPLGSLQRYKLILLHFFVFNLACHDEEFKRMASLMQIIITATETVDIQFVRGYIMSSEVV